MNLVEALEARGIEFHEHQSREDEIQICCPFCVENGETPDTRFRLGINLRTGWMGCFNCGKGSRSAVYTFQELQRVLGTGAMELQQEEMVRQRKRKAKQAVRLPEDFALVRCVKSTSHWNNVAYEYLKRRGISDQQIRDKEIGFSLVGEYRYRVILPIFEQGKLVGFVGRSFVRDLEPPYKNSMGEKTLYNLPAEPLHTAVLVEGSFDALAVERFTKRNLVKKEWADALGLLGHELTDRQLAMLEPYQRIILWLDPDVPGLKGTVKLAPLLEEQRKEIWVVVPKMDGSEEYDPSDLFPKEIDSMLHSAELWTQELAQRLQAKIVFRRE